MGIKVIPTGNKQTEIVKSNGIIVAYSHSHPIAVFIPGKGALVVNVRYGASTARHVNNAVRRWGCCATKVPPAIVEGWAEFEGKVQQ